MTVIELKAISGATLPIDAMPATMQKIVGAFPLTQGASCYRFV